MFYKIFRENLPLGIERRHKAGSPVLKAEIEELNKTLKLLNVNLSTEIHGLDLPAERPSIVPPPYEFKKMVDNMSLHPILQPQCIKLFTDGHINESVRKALEKYEKHVQQLSGLIDPIGKGLMANAFSETSPRIRIGDITTKRGKSLQEGIKFLSMGAMEFWRNLLSHGDEKQMPHIDAIAILATVSHLLYYIENNRMA
ncbi:MAG: TIGR02391 family protein [bacterium]